MSVRIRTTGWGLRRAAAAVVCRTMASKAPESPDFRSCSDSNLSCPSTPPSRKPEKTAVFTAPGPKKASPPSQTCFAGWTAADWRESVLG